MPHHSLCSATGIPHSTHTGRAFWLPVSCKSSGRKSYVLSRKNGPGGLQKSIFRRSSWPNEGWRSPSRTAGPAMVRPLAVHLKQRNSPPFDTLNGSAEKVARPQPRLRRRDTARAGDVDRDVPCPSADFLLPSIPRTSRSPARSLSMSMSLRAGTSYGEMPPPFLIAVVTRRRASHSPGSPRVTWRRSQACRCARRPNLVLGPPS